MRIREWLALWITNPRYMMEYTFRRHDPFSPLFRMRMQESGRYGSYEGYFWSTFGGRALNARIPSWAWEYVIPWRERGYPPGSFGQRHDRSWVTPDGRGPGDSLAAVTAGMFGKFPVWNGTSYDPPGTYRRLREPREQS